MLISRIARQRSPPPVPNIRPSPVPLFHARITDPNILGPNDRPRLLDDKHDLVALCPGLNGDTGFLQDHWPERAVPDPRDLTSPSLPGTSLPRRSTVTAMAFPLEIIQSHGN